MTATLLAVDDSKTMRKVIEITFAGENYKMVLADSPADAMAKLRAEKPSVALVDALLGGSSGYDLCQQIKSEAPQVGVIVLSSKQHPYDRVKGGAVGADDYLDKPFDSQALIDKVAALAQKLANAPAPAVRPAPVAAAPRPAAQAPLGQPPAAAAGLGASANLGATAARPHTTTMSFGAPSAARPANAAASTAAQAPAAAAPARPAAFAAPPAAAPAAAPPATSSAVPVVPPAAVPVAAPATSSAVPVAPAAAAPAVSALIDASMETKLTALGLTKDQIAGVVALSREVVEQVVWEVVPVLAETMIREEIRRLSAE